LSKVGIVSQLTVLGTPQKNGVLERRNMTLLEMMRAKMSYATLPISFWGYAIEIMVYLLNMIPSKSVSKVPMELWLGHKVSVNHIWIWGCLAHVLKGKTDKLEAKTEVCLFVGYPKGTKGYLVYSPKDLNVFVTTNAKFLKDDYVDSHELGSKVVIEEMQEVRRETF
jgi:hypothetical protein